MFFNHIDKPYKPPKIPNGFPIEIGIDLYNLDTSDEKFVEEFLEKYNIRTEIKTRKLIDIIKEEIRPIIDQAIVGAEPTCNDLKALNYFLLEEEHTEYVPYPLDKNLIPVIFDNQSEKINRYVIEENYQIFDRPFSTLWPIYKWIYLVWNMAIPVERCTAPNCNAIFIASNSKRVYCSTDCQEEAKRKNDRERTRRKAEKFHKILCDLIYMSLKLSKDTKWLRPKDAECLMQESKCLIASEIKTRLEYMIEKSQEYLAEHGMNYKNHERKYYKNPSERITKRSIEIPFLGNCDARSIARYLIAPQVKDMLKEKGIIIKPPQKQNKGNINCYRFILTERVN